MGDAGVNQRVYDLIVKSEGDLHYTQHKRFLMVVDRRQNKGRSGAREKREHWSFERAQCRVFEHQASALYRQSERSIHSTKPPAGNRAFKYSRKGKLAHKT